MVDFSKKPAVVVPKKTEDIIGMLGEPKLVEKRVKVEKWTPPAELIEFVLRAKTFAKKYAQTKKRWRKKEILHEENIEQDYLDYCAILQFDLAKLK